MLFQHAGTQTKPLAAKSSGRAPHHRRENTGTEPPGRGSQGKGRGIAVIRDSRDTAAQPPSTALAAACAPDLPQPAAASIPWRPAPRSGLIPLFEAASDTQRRERPGPSGDLVPAKGQPRAARRRFARLTGLTHLHPLRRGAVIGVTSRADKSSQSSQTPSRVDGDPAAQSHEVCGSGAARHADPYACSGVSAPRAEGTRRTTAIASSATDLHPSGHASSDAPTATRPSPLAVAGVSRVTPAATKHQSAGMGRRL